MSVSALPVSRRGLLVAACCGVLWGGIAGRIPAIWTVTTAAQPPDSIPLARAEGPFLLSATPTAIPLEGLKTPNISLATMISTLSPGGRLLLVVRGVTAEQQPGVVYQIYLDLPEGNLPDPTGPHYIGTLNFYRARPASSNATAGTFESFDITAAAARVEPLQMRDQPTTIVFAPAGRPADNARPSIGRLEVVRQ